MKKLNLLLAFVIGFAILSCSKDEDPTPDNTPDYIGTYNLISVESNLALDPDVTGVFNETDLLDNLSCPSLLILNINESFIWDYVILNQIFNNINGMVSYNNMECILFSGSEGTYQVNNNGIVFAFDSSISNTTALIGDDGITVSFTEDLPVENNGVIQVESVQITLTYK